MKDSHQKIAVIFNNFVGYTTGTYFCDVFDELKIPYERFTPSEQSRIGTDFSVRLYIDDGTHYAIRPARDVLKVLYLIDTHMDLAEDLVMTKMADLVFCAQKNALEPIRKRHPAAYWLPLGCSPALHYKEAGREKYDVAFVGGEGDLRRRQILQAVRDAYPNSFIGRASREEIGEIYSSAKIVVNTAINNDINMRFFEALCSGALLITDVITENGMEDLVGQDQALCAFYRTTSELLDKIKYYLEHEDERKEIAKQGQAFVQSHSYLDRWRYMETMIQQSRNLNQNHVDYVKVVLSLLSLSLHKRIKKMVSVPFA